MKAALGGRIVFGIASALFGFVSLMWHDSQLWHRSDPLGPFASIAAWAVAIALVTGGIAMPIAPAARVASIILSGVYAFFTLACVPDIVSTPLSFGAYVDFFEQLSALCGAIAVYALSTIHMIWSAKLIALAERALGACVLSFAWAQIAYFTFTASLVPTWIPPSSAFWTTVTTIAFGLAGIAILIRCRELLAMRLLALMLAVFGVFVWLPRVVTQYHMLFNLSEFAENCVILAGCLLMADASDMRTKRHYAPLLP